MKFNVSPLSPLLLYLDILHDSIMLVQYFEETIYGNVNFDHTQQLRDVSFTFEEGEEKSSLYDLFHPSSDQCYEIESEIIAFNIPVSMIH